MRLGNWWGEVVLYLELGLAKTFPSVINTNPNCTIMDVWMLGKAAGGGDFIALFVCPFLYFACIVVEDVAKKTTYRIISTNHYSEI